MIKRFRRLAALLVIAAALAACGERGPDTAALTDALQTSLDDAFQTRVLEVSELKRVGAADITVPGVLEPGLIVYYDAALTLKEAHDFTSWQGLSLGTLTNLLGATQQGVTGIRRGGNAAGDVLHVQGSARFVPLDGDWRLAANVQQPVPVPPPEYNTAPPAETRVVVDRIRALFSDLPTEEGRQRNRIIAEELERAYRAMVVKLERLDRTFIVVGGPEGGEYARIASSLAERLRLRGVRAKGFVTEGSIENARLLRAGSADVGIVQSDVAAAAFAGSGPFAGVGPDRDLRALASLFPEPVHVVAAPGSGIESIADLRGRKVNVGPPGSGTRFNAEAVLAAHGIGLGDLGEAREAEFVRARADLAAGAIDAMLVTIGAPTRTLQNLAATMGMRLVPLDPDAIAALTADTADLITFEIAAFTYPGQAHPVPTVAVTAMLVARSTTPDDAVDGVLAAVFDEIDFVAAGSAPGTLISRATAEVGVPIPMQEAASRFFGG